MKSYIMKSYITKSYIMKSYIMEVITPMIPLYFFKYYLTQGRNDTANGMKHIRRQVNNQRKSLQQRLRISIDQT